MRCRRFVSFSLAAILTGVAWASVPSTNTATPGRLNYVEGQADIADQALNSKSVGSAQLEEGQSLTTDNGKAEILLTPGVFLRVGNHSSVKMIASSITNTAVEIDRGHAILEVEEVHPENDIRVLQDGATVRILKTGLYDFNENQEELRVFDGLAYVENLSENVKVKGGHELTLDSSGKYKTHKFDQKMYEEGDLYRWSSLRSAYLAEANVDAASAYADEGWGWGPGLGWWGADWYWDPWFDAFTFIPGDGIFYSPFGWGFYSPWWVYDAPFYGYYGRYGYGHFYHHFSTNYHNWGPGSHYVGGRHYAHGIYRGPGSTGRGFRSGPMMASRGFGRMGSSGFHGGAFHGAGFHGGGFHGGFSGGGGFHGGGFGGGGFHGGGGGHGR